LRLRSTLAELLGEGFAGSRLEADWARRRAYLWVSRSIDELGEGDTVVPDRRKAST
jgi:hypothetical protein